MALDIVKSITHAFPNIKRNLLTARRNETPQEYVKKALIIGSYVGFAVAALFFFMFSRSMGFMTTLIIAPFLFLLGTFGMFMFRIQGVSVLITKRRNEIDREILFAGRYLLVKIESGAPMFNSLTDMSKSFGVGGKYFQEIVTDIETGKSLEEALEHAREYSASEKLKKLLWQVVISIKTGTDVTTALRSTLHTITLDQLREIRAYGKKLNSIMMFYLILAVVVPSLGTTLFLLVASFLSLAIPNFVFYIALLGLAFVQIMFLAVVKSSRPPVDI